MKIGKITNELIKLNLLDLYYLEDSNAQTDLNVVMNGTGKFIEIQGTAESKAFSMEELTEMLDVAKSGINTLFSKQKLSLGIT